MTVLPGEHSVINCIAVENHNVLDVNPHAVHIHNSVLD